MDDLDSLKAELLAAAEQAPDLPALEELRVRALGKKGRVTGLMKELGKLDPESRKARGQALNAVKDAVARAIEGRKHLLAEQALDARLQQERIDVSLPARPQAVGHLHPLSPTIDELVAIFGETGFSVAEGPHIEDDFHNCEALNIPAWHPARQDHDTFYLKAVDGVRPVLRPHTSPLHIRTMQKVTPPIRIICPGRTVRVE